MWINNPAYIQVRTVLPIGWVLENEDNRIVGYLGNIPLFYELNAQRILASVAHAWVVDEQYRPYSLMLLDEYFSQEVVDLFLNATVGPEASNSFAVFQSQPVPQGEWDRTAFWVTNYQGFLTSWLTMRTIPFAKPLGFALAIAPVVKQAFAQRMPSASSKRVDLHRCRDIDSRFDTFWNALRKNRPNVLLGVRSREVLEWHFKYALRNDEAWIVTAEEGSSISAYGIFLRYDNPNFALTRMRFVDYQALDGNTSFLLPMLSWALEKCRNESIHMLETIGLRTDKSDMITRNAPYKRTFPFWLYYYKARDRSLDRMLSDLKVWDPSLFDGDASL